MWSTNKSYRPGSSLASAGARSPAPCNQQPRARSTSASSVPARTQSPFRRARKKGHSFLRDELVSRREEVVLRRPDKEQTIPLQRFFGRWAASRTLTEPFDSSRLRECIVAGQSVTENINQRSSPYRKADRVRAKLGVRAPLRGARPFR